MNAKLTKALSEQAGREASNAQLYLALSVWADVKQYRGARKWFREQSAEEIGHRDLLLGLVTGYCREHPTIADVDSPIVEALSLVDAFRSVVEAEEANTQQLNFISDAAEDEGAHEIEAFLVPMLQEQVRSVSFAADIVARLERIGDDAAAVEIVDAYLGSVAG